MENIDDWIITKMTEEWDHAAIGAKLRKVRKRAGLTLREVSPKIKLSPAYLCDLEHGNRNWSERRIEEYLIAVDFGSVI